MANSQKVIDVSNAHYNLNLELGSVYAQYAHIADDQFSMPFLAKFINDLSNDKLGVHKDLISEYARKIEIPLHTKFSVDVSFKPTDPKELVKHILETEQKVRKHVANMAKVCLEEGDFETFSFVKWFVDDGIKDFDDVRTIHDFFENGNNNLQVEYAIRQIFKANEAWGRKII
uniref:Uncharacterized protein UU427 homolog n=1 Tax=Ureaplasma urealyticum TaxID=2130 RepID=Y427_UREUR|nr:RecName: Full=Uncharacterized protein UU427 homolog [Ureaplasma urealyticum]